MRRAVTILGLIAMASAVALVQVRQSARAWFIEHQQLQAERDALNTEWGRLLLEQSTWSVHGRVERVARGRLDMVMPDPDQVVTLRTAETATP